MNGKLQTKTISKALVNRNYLVRIAEFILLLGLGVLAVTLHARLRYPLHTPGHHGIEFITILLFSKKISQFKASGSIFSMGAGLFLLLPILGIKDPMAPIVYMIPGFTIDLFFNIIPQVKKKFLLSIIFGGLAYATIPLTRILLMAFSGYQYKAAIVNGPFIPLVLFFSFGLVGALFTTGILKAFKKNY